MKRILRIVLAGVLVVAVDPVLAQDGDRGEPAAIDDRPRNERRGHGLLGSLVGAAAGIAVGFAVAASTDYALKEGGAFGVMLLGGGLGGFVGHKIGSSAGRPWEEPGELQLSLRYAWTASSAGGSTPGWSCPGCPLRAFGAPIPART
jgi:hypothetical protein